MNRILGEDIECPFCGKVFFKDDEVKVYEFKTKLFIHCTGCGSDLDVELHDDGKIYI